MRVWHKNKSAICQLSREMFFPFLLAASWTGWVLFDSSEKPTFVAAIKTFGPTFFLVCWGFAQWFRVRKQQAVETGLVSIVSQQKELLAALEAAADRLEGHASGGESFAWILSNHAFDGSYLNISAVVEGKYPVFEARASVVNWSNVGLGVDEVFRTGRLADMYKHHVNIQFGTVLPNAAQLCREYVPCDTAGKVLQFRVDWSARNGRWTQYIELKRRESGWVFFTAVERGGKLVLERPARSDVPLTDDGKPDVFWFTHPHVLPKETEQAPATDI